MTEYLTEQEQVELLKGWIKQYSLVIVAGVLIAMAAITGWRFWQQRQTKIVTHASAVFDEMLTKRAQGNPAAATIQANKLFDHYASTAYGEFAAFILARDAALKGDYLEAENQLQWVVKNSSIKSLQQIARLRLARVLIEEFKLQEALDVLEKVEDPSFNGLIAEVKGDAYLAMQKIDLARQAYQLAIKELPNAEVIRPLLQMKYDNLVN